MAEKLIKQFTIGSDTGKIDYEAGVGGNKPDVASISPKKVKISWTDTNIKKITGYKYYASSTSFDGNPATLSSGQTLYARDGDFGYVVLDEAGLLDKDNDPIYSGQINLGVSLDPTRDVLVPVVQSETAPYNTFKTPYTTCVDNLYRFTKVNSSFDVNFTTSTESLMEAYGVTYKLVLPEGYEGTAPVITEFRSNDAMLASYKGQTVVFTEGSSVGHKTYSKDTGYPDKSFKSATEGDAAQVNFSVVGTLPEGYTMSVAVSPKKYKNLKISADKTQYQLTKVYGDEEITVTIAPPVTVTYATAHTPVEAKDYVWSYDASEIPQTCGKGSDLVCAFYHQTWADQAPDADHKPGNPTEKAAAVPDGTGCGGSGKLPTAAACLNRIVSCTINGAAFTITDSMITVGGKKATLTIPGTNITGNVVITLGSYSA